MEYFLKDSPTKLLREIWKTQKRVSYTIRSLDDTCDCVNDTYWTRSAIEKLKSQADAIQQRDFSSNGYFEEEFSELIKEKKTSEANETMESKLFR